MEESFANLPSSHLLGSVPAVVSGDQKTTNKEVPGANLQIFPPNNGGGGGQGQGQGYQTVGGVSGSIYGYALIVPLAYYFLLQYIGSSASLVRFWCLWGYSLFIFVLSSVVSAGYSS
ncbi:uncharacterized protein LOC142532951 isoform X2 [Primulina tabacum]|uniref:uncharacterized protein LOC142532951 isoform X2 n=1 Tax=Primulina tabacum TaxID=48773 RepID=UPI003F5A4E4D